MKPMKSRQHNVNGRGRTHGYAIWPTVILTMKPRLRR